MGRQLPQVAVKPEDLPELRAATREAHEAAQELRQAAKDLQAAHDAARRDINDQLRRAVDAQLKSLGGELAMQRDRATQLIIRSMNELWAGMIGADPETVHSKSEPHELAQLLHEHVVERIDALRADVDKLMGRTGHVETPMGAGLPEVLSGSAVELDWRNRGRTPPPKGADR